MLRSIARIVAATTLGAAALAAVVPEAAAQSAALVLRAGENRRVGTFPPPILRTAEASGLAVNPTDPNHVVEAEVNPRYGLCQYNVSFDRGDTWTTGVLRAPARFGGAPCTGFNNVNRLRFDGGIVFGSGGNVYVTFDSYPPDGSEGSTTLVARSTDGGRTFGEARVVMAGTTGIEVGFGNAEGQKNAFLRPKIGVLPRPNGDRVVIASNGTGFNTRTVSVVVSEDSGATWSAPVSAQPAGETAQYISNPVLDSSGNIFIAWRTQHSTTLGFPANADEFNWFSRSNDGGRTWTNTVVRKLAAANATARVNERRLAIDRRDGTLYYVDNETVRTNDPDIFVQRSTDGGGTWSAPVRVNDDPPASPPVQQSVPNVSVAPNGRLDIAFSDRRVSYGNAASHEIYLASSIDGGRTFSANRRLTDRTLSQTNGLVTVRSTDFFVPGLAPLGNDELLVSWPDSRETTFDTENTDIYAARVRINPTGPPPATRLPLAQPAGLSVALSRLAYPGGAEKHAGGATTPGTRLVIVNEGDVGGALAGGVLARANLGAVLASPAAGLTPEVAAEVRRVGPIEVLLLGNEDALSPTLVGELVRAGAPADRIFRLAAPTAAERAKLVAETYTQIEKAANRPVGTTAVVVDPDSREAATASLLAAGQRYPVLFAGRETLPAATAQAITALGITSTLVIGGPGTISDAVLRQLPQATRVGGSDLYGTARAVAERATAEGIPDNVAYVTAGERPIDGALAGAAVARLGGTLVVAPGGDAGAARGGVDRVVLVRSVADPGPGYRMVSSDGGVFAFGGSRFLGSTAAIPMAKPVVGMASIVDGYWLVASDGGVFAFGEAAFYGSTGALALNAPIVGMAATPTGLGYWLVAADGGVFAFGDARFHGSTGAMRLNQPIVAMTPSATGRGYLLVASDGGVFAFGDAEFRGSTGALKLNRPIVDAAATPSGRGYLLVASDGGVFAFGDAVFRGSTGGMRLSRPIVGITTLGTAGYWLAAADGGVFAFGGAPFLGSAGRTSLARPVVGAAG